MGGPMNTDLEAALRRPPAYADDETFLPDLTAAADGAGLLDVAYTTTESPVGTLVLAAGDTGLVSCSYDDEDAVLERIARRLSPRVLRAPRRLDAVRRQLDDYFAGRSHRFEVPVDLAIAAPFGRAVLDAAASIPYGSTTTYAAIAAQLGKPNAARAV